MPTLVVEHEGHLKAGALNGRVVIGRRANSHLRIPDRAVSRIHAWIGQAEGGYFIADCGSRVGTRINGQLLHGRKKLEDGDQITIASALIKFRSAGAVPEGSEPLDLSPHLGESDDGIFIDCACGAPLWAPWDFAGRVGQCRYCGNMVAMPAPEGKTPSHDPSSETIGAGLPLMPTAHSTRGLKMEPAAQPVERRTRRSIFDEPAPPPPVPVAPDETQSEVICGACQLPVSLLEEKYECPECGVTLHAECWTENLGCSTYGCKQVGVLDPHRDEPKITASPAAAEDAGVAGADVEWAYLFLAMSLGAALLGAMSFGVPPAMVGIVIVVYLMFRRTRGHQWMLAASMVISFLSSLVGFCFSWYWWMSSTLRGPFHL
jgi:pSer/pThr/pTyr-binding forkhead associated (FHA) protein